MTLIEVVVSLLIAVIVFGGIISGYIESSYRAEWSGYYAPTRQFSFDSNFMTPSKLPPGTPTLGSITRSKWTIPPPSTINYAGN